MGEQLIRGLTVEPGTARGLPLALAEPVSFWGGYDSKSGVIIDTTHPDRGTSMTNRIVFMARSKGSSSSSSVLAEAIRNETGPSAIIMLEKDLIVALGSIVARELYRIEVPIVVVSSTDWPILVAIKTTVEVRASSTGDAEIRWVPPPSKTF